MLRIIIVTIILFLTACSHQAAVPVEEMKERDIHVEEKQFYSLSLYLEQIKQATEEGTVPGSTFNAINNTMDDVIYKWGNPDRVDQAGYGYYATFQERQIVFGYTQAREIFDVRLVADRLSEVNIPMVIQFFGEPAEIRKLPDEEIYVYPVTETIQLKWIASRSTGQIRHISVFNKMKAEHGAGKANDYVLDIRGTSDQLSHQAWERMKMWRKHIVQFAREQENVYIHGPNKKKVALTFDDGPDHEVTPAIIDILNRYNVKGTFFFVGAKIGEAPDVVRAAYENGHLVLSHTHNHFELTKLDDNEIEKEIELARDAIDEVIGKKPILLRTPYGDTDETVAAIAAKSGQSIILWSIDTLDWSGISVEHISRNVLENVRNGDIILMHSSKDQAVTVAALPIIIEGLKERGFTIVDVATMLNLPAYE